MIEQTDRTRNKERGKRDQEQSPTKLDRENKRESRAVVLEQTAHGSWIGASGAHRCAPSGRWGENARNRWWRGRLGAASISLFTRAYHGPQEAGKARRNHASLQPLSAARLVRTMHSCPSDAVTWIPHTPHQVAKVTPAAVANQNRGETLLLKL